jgi:predicted amidohydrolase
MPRHSFYAVVMTLCLVRMAQAKAGLLVGAQIRLTQYDYRTEATFTAALERTLKRVRMDHPEPGPKLVVFPECIGLALVLTGSRPVVFKMAWMAEAISSVAGVLMVKDPAFRTAFHAWMRRTGGNIARSTSNAMLTHLGKRAFSTYLRVFTRLARKYGYYICAGSLYCPAFELVGGAPRFSDAIDIFNTCLTFDPDGRVINVTRKVFPTASENGTVTPAPLEQMNVFDTELGRTGAMVCADAWFPECYQRFRAQGIKILLQPSMGFDATIWNQPWRGYSGQAGPIDVDPADIGRLTEGEAWRKYSLLGRIGSSGARFGVNPFQVGYLWEHQTGGQGMVVKGTPQSGYFPIFAPSESAECLHYLPCPLDPDRETPFPKVGMNASRWEKAHPPVRQ